MAILGIDISHHQGGVDFSRVKGSGREFVVAKASERADYKDDYFDRYRTGAHSAGLVFGAYHFAGSSLNGSVGDATVEANHFCDVVGTLQTGEFAVLDWEPGKPPSNAPAWCRTWLDRVQTRLGVKPLIYMNSSTVARYNWATVAGADYGLWLAKYDNSSDQPQITSAWPLIAMKQFSDRGAVPGVSGGVDVDAFYGDVSTLLRYAKQGAAPAPAPAPTPPPPPPAPAPSFDVRAWRVSANQSDPHIPNLREWANRVFPGYATTPLSTDRSITNYGPQLVAFIKEFGGRVGLINDGKDIGPKLAAALYNQGFRG